MTVGELVVKIAADTDALKRDLAAARAEIAAFGDSVKGSSTNVEKLSKDTDTLAGSLKKSRAELDKAKSDIPLVGGLFDAFNRQILNGTTDLLGMIPGLSGVQQAFASLAPEMLPVLGYIEVLPAAIFAVVFAGYALADMLGTVLAIFGDLIAPLGLIAGLLGGLGFGFVLAAKRAADGGGKLQVFADKLATLKSMFGKTTDILAHAFLPILVQLASDAERALLFIDKLAREPLGKAMRDMATQGVQGLAKFVQQIAGFVAHPIRLAFKIAFGAGPGGNEFASLVSSWWTQLQNFLFGYTASHPIKLNGRTIGFDTKTINGALQPFIDWWNRHHFTAQGIKLGHEIVSGLVKSGALQNVGKYLKTVFADAAVQAAKALIGAPFRAAWAWIKSTAVATWHYDVKALKSILGAGWAWAKKSAASAWHSAAAALKSALGNAWSWVKARAGGLLHAIATIGRTEASSLAQATRSLLGDAWQAVRSAASGVWHAIEGIVSRQVHSAANAVKSALHSAWESVLSTARSIWHTIVSIFTAPLHIHLSFPSLPSLSSIIHGGAGLLGAATGGNLSPNDVRVVGERGPELFVPNTSGKIIPNHALAASGGKGDVYVILSGNTILGDDRKVARDLARILRPHLDRQVILSRT